jgi:hypothetical protein
MRFLIALNLLCLPLLFVSSQSSSQRGTAQTPAKQAESQLLRLTTNVVSENYCSEMDATFLQWRLKLTYTNVSQRPVLFDPKSKWIYRTLVSRDLKAASAQQYEQAPESTFGDLRKFGFNNTPEEASFIVLKPGEVFNVDSDARVMVDDGMPDIHHDLGVGDHVLQVRVATWYYLVNPAAYREQWSSRGDLYSSNITSVPLPFTIKKERTVTPCNTGRQ